MDGMNMRIFFKAFKDVKGIDLATIDLHSKKRMHINTKLRTKTGSILIAYKGKIIASSDGEDYQLYGFNQIRRWIRKKLDALGVSYKMDTIDFGRVAPYQGDKSIRLKYKLIAAYDFNDKKYIQKQTEKRKVYIGKKASITGCTLYNNPDKKSQYNTYFVAEEIDKNSKPFTIGLNFKMKKHEYSWQFDDNIIFQSSPRVFTLYVFQGYIVLKVQTWIRLRKTGPITRQYEYYFENYLVNETSLQLEKWHHLIFSYYPSKRRIGLMVNGKRLKDIKMSSQLINRIRKKANNVYGFQLRDQGVRRNIGFRGNIDNVVIYNRALNQQEMKAIFNLSKPGNQKLNLK